jgi:hypothetical protein
MSDDMTIQLGGEEYVVRREDDGLRVGRRVRDDVVWLQTVELSLLRGPAREALDRGDTTDEALLNTVRGVAQAEVERGG